MTNFQVYKKTLPFSLIMFLTDLVSISLLVGSCVAGFFIANNATDLGIVGLVVGLVIGIILASLFSFFITNRIKAAQIAMMTKGVTEDQLPEHTVKEGFNELHGRFGKIYLFFAITNAIKGIFNQIGRGITRIGGAIGGDVGSGIGSAVDSAIQTLISYLCDCCLGWVLFRKNENSAKAACEGAVIFFKHGKTLIRNVGRIFGMGFLSLFLVGGAFFGGFYALFSNVPLLQPLANEIIEAIQRSGEEVPAFLNSPVLVNLVASGIGGIIIWSVLHSVLIRPFILVGVLRNFMAAGKENIPTEADLAELDSKSPKFAKLRQKSFN